MRSNVLTLLRLDLRSRVAKEKKGGVKGLIKTLFNVVFTLVIYAVIVMGIYYLTQMFMSSTRVSLNYEFLVIATTLTLAVQILITTGALVKNMYFNGDNELLLRFPVSGTEVLLAKSIYVMLYNFVVGLLLVMPFYICYGIVTDASWTFYLTAVGVFLLSSILPFAIANIIAVPVMWLVNAVKNKFLIVLILLIVLISVGFAVYMTVLTNIMEYMQDQSVSIFSDEIVAMLSNFAANAYPFNFYANLLAGKDIGLSVGVTLGMSTVLMLLAFFIVKKTYYRTILKGIESEKTAFHKKTSSRQRSIFGTLLRREFLMIFRSFNYCFQYFAMAVAAPVMVYFCNSLAASIGSSSVGMQIIPGLTLLVVTIFITIIVSFASTAISREGNTFYMTKTIPVPYKTQVTAKLFLYWLVATLSVAASCVVVYFGFSGDKYGDVIKVVDILYLFAICECLVIALSCLTIRSDIKSPTFNVSGDGELVDANKNVALAIFFGCVLAIVFGLIAMLFSFIPLKIGSLQIIPEKDGIYTVYWILLAVSALLAIISVFALYHKIERKYARIMA